MQEEQAEALVQTEAAVVVEEQVVQVQLHLIHQLQVVEVLV